jgi:hypothetical protein
MSPLPRGGPMKLEGIHPLTLDLFNLLDEIHDPSSGVERCRFS